MAIKRRIGHCGINSTWSKRESTTVVVIVNGQKEELATVVATAHGQKEENWLLW